MTSITLGIDLAKSTFSIVGIDTHGKITVKKTLSRAKLLPFIAQHPQATIGMEACSGAHYWGREFTKLGHSVKIMAAKYVSPFLKGGKNDINDAEAISEAAQRPRINTVPIKTPDQQALQLIHRIRELAIKERTALINQTHGLLAEFGILLPRGKDRFLQQLPQELADAENGLPDHARLVMNDLLQRIKHLNKTVLNYDQELKKVMENNDQAKRINTIPGVGVKTATGVLAAVPDPLMFKNGREFAAWLGLVPKQFSTGGKIKLGRITKAGNSYLRTCLIHGARAVVNQLGDKQDKVSCWVRNLIERRGYFKALVALAARNARLIWTLMIKQEDYKTVYA